MALDVDKGIISLVIQIKAESVLPYPHTLVANKIKKNVLLI